MLSFVVPLSALSVLPQTLLLLALHVHVVANARLFPVDPGAFVLASVFPDESAFAVSLILHELADVLFAVWPDQMPMTVHFVV